MRVLLTSLLTSRNKGCEALAKSIAIGLRSQFGDCRISVLSETPAYDQRFLGDVGIRVVDARGSRPLWEKLRTPYQLASRYFPQLPRSAYFERRLGPIRDADLVISSGGDVFTGTYGSRDKHLQPLETAIALRKPVACLAHSFEPLADSNEMKRFMRIARAADMVTVREALTLSLTESWNMAPGRFSEVADPAFLLPSASQQQVGTLLRAYGISPNDPVVVLAPSQGISRFVGIPNHQHTSTWHGLVTWLLNETDYRILLLPHVTTSDDSNDDRVVVNRLYKALDFPSRVVPVLLEHTAEELKGLIAHSVLLVGERTHATIASLSSAVPTVAISYSAKAPGIMRQVLGEAAGRWVMPASTMTDTMLVRAVQAALAESAALRCQLAEVLPRQQELAMRNFRALADILPNQPANSAPVRLGARFSMSL